MFKNFVVRQLLKSKLKNVPEAEQEKIMTILEKNPDFFMKMAAEIQEKTKQGIPEQQAALSVMQSHQEEIKKILA